MAWMVCLCSPLAKRFEEGNFSGAALKLDAKWQKF